MKRRQLLLLLGSAITMAPGVSAQENAMPVVGYLSTDSAPSSQNAPVLAAFRQGLGETGYVEGQNLAIEYIRAGNNYDRLPALAADLVGRKVDLIVTITAAPSVAAKNATSTIPIVFLGVSDPVAVPMSAPADRAGQA